MCAAQVKDFHVPDISLALVTASLELPNPWNGDRFRLITYHDCQTGHLGICDLVGGELKENE